MNKTRKDCVLITTSGIGDRLGKYTQFTNKALVRVGDMAAISHIIALYPDSKFVITLGYKGHLVKKYLEYAHSKEQFVFCQVDDYQGENSSLLYSMYQAREHLQGPFIFHACDTILKLPPPPVESNWMLGCKSIHPENYRSFAVKDGDIVRINDEKHAYLDDSEYCYVGVAGIKAYELFWKNAEIILKKSSDNQLSDVHVLKQMSHLFIAQYTDEDDWYDIGNLDGLHRAKESFETTFNVLDKYNEDIYIVGDRVIKYFDNELICRNRIFRGKRYLQDISPEIIKSCRNFYTYNKIEGSVFSDTITEDKMVQFLDWMQKELWESRQVGVFKDQCFNFYITKTKIRLEQYLDGFDESVLLINGIIVPKAESLIDSISRVSIMFRGIKSKFHGDLVLDNIIDTGFGDFVLIDWRQDFDGNLEYGDMYYDLAKFGHSLILKHSALLKDEFIVEHIPSESKYPAYRLDIMKSEILSKCFEEFEVWCKDHIYYWAKIKTLMALIWINMAPLHDKKIGRFLYMYGRYNLFLSLKDLSNESHAARRTEASEK